VTSAFYRIAREALNNVVVHSGASHVNLSLVEKDGPVVKEIQDNGTGFDPQGVQTGRLGLRIMAERAEKIGADLQVESQPGNGTGIRLTWDKENKAGLE
jgi:signal transduction histidine kinase